jgi:hypothetical protein
MDGDNGSEGCMSLKGDVKGGCNDRLEIGDDHVVLQFPGIS